MPQPYEWAVLRVVPRVERCEFVNVGVVVYCRALDYLDAVTTADLDRALALDPRLDADAVLAHLAQIEAVCRGEASSGASGLRSPGDRFRWLVAPRSAMIQTSPAHAGVCDDPAAALEDLLARLVRRL